MQITDLATRGHTDADITKQLLSQNSLPGQPEIIAAVAVDAADKLKAAANHAFQKL